VGREWWNSWLEERVEKWHPLCRDLVYRFRGPLEALDSALRERPDFWNSGRLLEALAALRRLRGGFEDWLREELRKHMDGLVVRRDGRPEGYRPSFIHQLFEAVDVVKDVCRKFWLTAVCGTVSLSCRARHGHYVLEVEDEHDVKVFFVATSDYYVRDCEECGGEYTVIRSASLPLVRCLSLEDGELTGEPIEPLVLKRLFEKWRRPLEILTEMQRLLVDWRSLCRVSIDEILSEEYCKKFPSEEES